MSSLDTETTELRLSSFYSQEEMVAGEAGELGRAMVTMSSLASTDHSTAGPDHFRSQVLRHTGDFTLLVAIDWSTGRCSILRSPVDSSIAGLPGGAAPRPAPAQQAARPLLRDLHPGPGGRPPPAPAALQGRGGRASRHRAQGRSDFYN